MSNRVLRLTESDAATVYGCCGLFDLCNDRDLMSLSFAGQEPFLDWLGWEASLECKIRKAFLTYVRPEQSEGSCTPGYLSDPCADPYSFEWGKCEFELTDFGRLRREGPVRDITEVGLRLCANQPRYRLDGTEIVDDRELDMRLAMEVLLQDLKRMVVSGNSSTSGQFDGLAQLVKTNYTDPSGQRCAAMDSIVINWNGNSLSGGAGITWNGNAVGTTFDFVDVLRAVVRRIRQRIAAAPALASQALRVGDIVLVLPSFAAYCLLDFFACWSVCPGSQYNEVSGDTRAALNAYRAQLNGGMFGAGRIYIDGLEIPLIAYDWDTIQGPTTADIYLLVRGVGNTRVLHGQYLDMRSVPGTYPGVDYQYTDGGRVLTWTVQDHTCVKQVVEMRPRLLCWAPWAQAVFNDVVCNVPGGPLSLDPCATSFFPETSFVPASCS